MRRSFFRMQPGSPRYFTQWIYDVWRNKVLFGSVMAGFILIFPLLYIPIINHDVFVHEGISWEWAIVFIGAALFFAGVEMWKWAKRLVLRRIRVDEADQGQDRRESVVFGAYLKHADSGSDREPDLEKEVG